jgi:uncharacterized protein (DUF433 family)
MATETLTEAEKMARVPGISYMDGATGRRACIAGTGLDVWELISVYKEGGWDALRATFNWLSDGQLRAAVTFYDTFPEEIDERLAREQWWTEERVKAMFPPKHKRA